MTQGIYARKEHRLHHAIGGYDPVAPADIGALPVSTQIDRVWVDPIGGDDSWEGTESRPIATLAELRSRWGGVRRHDLYVRLSEGTHDFANFDTWIFQGGNVAILGASAYSESGRDVIASNVVEAGSAKDNLVASGLTDDEYMAHGIDFRTGAFAGYRRMCAWNTPTNVILARDLPGAPADGDQYDVFRSKTKLSFASAGVYGFVGPTPGLVSAARPPGRMYLVGVDFDQSGVDEFDRLLIVSGEVNFVGVGRSTHGDPFMLIQGVLLMGLDSSFLVDGLFVGATELKTELGLVTDEHWAGWGHGSNSTPNQSRLWPEGAGAAAVGYFCGRSTIGPGGSLYLYGGSLNEPFGLNVPFGALLHVGDSKGRSRLHLAFTDGLTVSGDARIAQSTGFDVDVTALGAGPTNSWFQARNAGRIQIGSGVTVGTVTAPQSGNPTYGIEALHGGRIMTTGAPPAFPAATAEIKAGAATGTAVSLAATGDRLTDNDPQPDGSIIQRM